MHTYKHASGVYNACETAKLRLFILIKPYVLPAYIYVYHRELKEELICSICYHLQSGLLFVDPLIDWSVHRVICKHSVSDQIQNLQNCFTIPNKNLGGEGASDR
jgi:hypothetical protein